MLDVTPVNTAVLSGQSAVLRCRSSSGVSATISWTQRRVNVSIIAAGCTLLPNISPVYSLTSDGAGQCDLVISSVDASLTGVYGCVEATGETPQAYLTIIGKCTWFNNMCVRFLIISDVDIGEMN